MAQMISDMQLQQTLANFDAEKRAALQRPQDDDWAGVQVAARARQGLLASAGRR
jgi:hypothetical protein